MEKRNSMTGKGKNETQLQADGKTKFNDRQRDKRKSMIGRG